MLDDNDEIIRMIQERMAVGRERYGHGIRSEDDTRQWDTRDDTWAEMGLEEALDLSLYLCAELIRIKNARKGVYLPERTPPPSTTPPKQKKAHRGRLSGRFQRLFGWWR